MADYTLDNPPELSISPDKVCFIVVKARDFDAKDVVTDPDDSSNVTDDAMLSVLEDHKDDPVVQEISAAIFGMTEDEQIDLVALAWPVAATVQSRIGTSCARKLARADNKRTASYLLGMPLLPDHLEEGLSQLGMSCEE